MKKCGKPISVKVTLTYPKSSHKYKCQAGYRGLERTPSGTWIKLSSLGEVNHHLEQGDELILCTHARCQRQLCQRHMPDHKERHTLADLAGPTN